MWNPKSRFRTQTSAWCDTASVSGSGFLSKFGTSISGFSENDPPLRRWRSLSHLASEDASQSFLGPGLRVAQRRAELLNWLQDAHEHLDTHLDLLGSRDTQLGYKMTPAQLLDMKHKQCVEALQQKEITELPRFEKSLHDKVQQLKKDLLQMRSALDRGDQDPHVSSRQNPSFAANQGDTNRRVAQRSQLDQIDQMNQILSHIEQNHSEVQGQLHEANNRISQACLEKASLSTQVLKLEDNLKEVKDCLSRALSEKNLLIQEKSDLLQRSQQLKQQLEQFQQVSGSLELHRDGHHIHNSKHNQEILSLKDETNAFREINEKLTNELKMVKHSLETTQSQLQELKSEKVSNATKIKDLMAELSQMIREKEELLSKLNEAEQEGLTEMKEKHRQLRESLEAITLEKQKLQDQYLCLENEVLKTKEKLHRQEEEHQRREAVRVQNIEELKAVAKHWTEKWQKTASTLRSTQEELEELKNDKKKSDSLLRVELEVCKQELELQRSRSQKLCHRHEDEGGESVSAQDKETITDLSMTPQTESSFSLEPASVSHFSLNKTCQPLVEKASRDEKRVQTDFWSADTPPAQLQDNKRRANMLQQEKALVERKLACSVDSPSVAGRKEKTDNVEEDQQRKRVTGQNSVDRVCWGGLTPVYEEDEENYDWTDSDEGEQAEEAERNVQNQP